VTSPDQVRDLLRAHCFTRPLSPEHVDRLVEHSFVERRVEGATLFREGQPAENLLLVVDGRVAVEMFIPGRGPQVIDTVEACETVGWSWLVPPYRWFFDARAVTDVTLVEVDAAALRELAESDPAFGYALMRQVADVMLGRMQAARLKLADLYGVPAT
jgi:CRP/FNR family cyclic AMP-dependent transcriptional regulator